MIDPRVDRISFVSQYTHKIVTTHYNVLFKRLRDAVEFLCVGTKRASPMQVTCLSLWQLRYDDAFIDATVVTAVAAMTSAPGARQILHSY